MIRLTIQTAQKMLMTYKGHSVSVDDCRNVFINYAGDIIFLHNAFNHTIIGKCKINGECEIKGVRYAIELEQKQ